MSMGDRGDFMGGGGKRAPWLRVAKRTVQRSSAARLRALSSSRCPGRSLRHPIASAVRPSSLRLADVTLPNAAILTHTNGACPGAHTATVLPITPERFDPLTRLPARVHAISSRLGALSSRSSLVFFRN